MDIAEVLRRLLVGRPVRSDERKPLPKRFALPVFASGALSSLAYVPEQILLTLALAGGAAVLLSPWVGVAVVVVLLLAVAAYRQNVRAYPSGGGDYEVVSTNLGRRAGLIVAAAQLVEYALTVAIAVSVSSHYLHAAIPMLADHEAQVAVVLIILLTLANLRGVRDSGRFLALPTYAYLVMLSALVITGLVKGALGTLGKAPSAVFEIASDAAFSQGLVGVAGVLLVMRAFASGCATLTGLQGIPIWVPAFQHPKSRNAARTLVLFGLVTGVALVSILTLAQQTGVKVVENPAQQLLRAGVPVGDSYVQEAAMIQITQAVFDGSRPLVLTMAVVTALLLLIAAHGAFNAFPHLGSVLARDGYLPRQLHTRGDRLAYSNGILILALGSGALVATYNAQVNSLIHLYVVGLLISFTMSQAGMVRHWTRRLHEVGDRKVRQQVRSSRVINALGFTFAGITLVVVFVAKLFHGVWVTLLLIAVLYLICTAIYRHYEQVARSLSLDETLIEGGDARRAKAYDENRALPARVHALVMVSKVHQPTLRAIAYARATYPSTLEAITVCVSRDETRELRKAWLDARVTVPLTVLASPFREITHPVIDYVRSVRAEKPRDVVVVYVPEYVVGHWWERLLHNQSAQRLRSRLQLVPGVIISSVPFQLHHEDHLTAPMPKAEELSNTHYRRPPMPYQSWTPY